MKLARLTVKIEKEGGGWHESKVILPEDIASDIVNKSFSWEEDYVTTFKMLKEYAKRVEEHRKTPIKFGDQVNE